MNAERAPLAAHARSIHQGGFALDRLSVPTLVIAGEDDALAAEPHVLAGAIPHATSVIVPGDHLRAVGGTEFIRAATDFLGEG